MYVRIDKTAKCLLSIKYEYSIGISYKVLDGKTLAANTRIWKGRIIHSNYLVASRIAYSRMAYQSNEKQWSPE